MPTVRSSVFNIENRARFGWDFCGGIGLLTGFKFFPDQRIRIQPDGGPPPI